MKKMKNLTKIIVLAAIAVFVAVSCAPEVEVTKFNWSVINAEKDLKQNSTPIDYTLYVPSALVTREVYSTVAGEEDILIGIEIAITIPDGADVLRKPITEASLKEFISFHPFTKADTILDADTLLAEIPFTLVKTEGKTATVKLTTSIDTASTNLDYSNLVMQVDCTKYPVLHGLRLDIDQNGKIEAEYDDWYTVELWLGSWSGNYANVTGYTRPGQISDPTIKTTIKIEDFPVVTSEVSSIPLLDPPPNYFVFNGKETTTTNVNVLRVADIGYVDYDTSDPSDPVAIESAAKNAYFRDVGETLARGIKLQKLNGTEWTDAGTATYDRTSTDSKGWIIINTSFEHLATYRLIWTGAAYTETDGPSFNGVSQRLRIYYGNSDTASYRNTEVIGPRFTAVNIYAKNFIRVSSFSEYLTVSRETHDSEYKNMVLKVKLNAPLNAQFFWSNPSITLADFKKSFKLVYTPSGTAPSNTADNLVYVDIKAIKFANEMLTGADPTGENVLYITIDPAFRYAPGQSLYFRINDDISITDKAAAPQLQYFGNSNNSFYNYFEFYTSGSSGPSTPSGVSAMAMTSGIIMVSWSSVSGADGYVIYRSTSPSGPYNYWDSANTIAYLDSGLSAETTYYYRVTARNSNGDESAQSSSVWATTLASGGGSDLGTEDNPIPLSPNIWTDGSITSTASAMWYSFNVSYGNTYYVYWDDSDNSGYSLDARVAAYYSDGTEIFDEDTNGGTNAQSFHAESGGTVKIMVYPYSSNGTGSFRVTYSTSSIRP